MEQPSSRESGSKHDLKTALFRVFTVFAYIAFGSVIFHLLESDAASLRVAKFEEYYNKTMADILSRCTSKQTNINITMAHIRQTFMQDVFPKEWDNWGGINITVQAMTTIGQYLLTKIFLSQTEFDVSNYNNLPNEGPSLET